MVYARTSILEPVYLRTKSVKILCAADMTTYTYISARLTSISETEVGPRRVCWPGSMEDVHEEFVAKTANKLTATAEEVLKHVERVGVMLPTTAFMRFQSFL